MDAIGLWRHPEYLSKKEQRTARDDPREIMPSCIVKVYNITLHSQDVRRRYPNPPDVPYADYSSTFDCNEEDTAST
jgi:hypothetical protein